MEVPITFTAEGSPPRDIVVRFDAHSTVAEVADQLGAPGRSLWLDSTPLGADLPLVDAGLTAGSRLTAAGPGPPRPGPEDAPLELAVVGGLRAGPTFRLLPGDRTIGRDPECDVVLADDLVSRLHARLSVADDGTVAIEDLDSANGTTVNKARVTAPTTIQPRDLISVGSTILTVVPASPAKANLEPANDGRLRYNKPPRTVPQWDAPTIGLPEKPPPPTGLHLPLGTVLAPLVLGPLFFLFTRQVPGLMLLMLASPIIACLNGVLDQRSGRRKYRKRLAEYEAAKATFGERAAEAAHRDEEARRAAFPDPAAVGNIARVPTGQLWERRPEDPDYLALRIGLADQPARIKLSGLIGEETTVPIATLVPVTVPLAKAGVVGLAGPRHEALAVLRDLLLQLTTLHSPNDVSVVILSDGNAPDWEWAKWLPHTPPRHHEPCVRLFGLTAPQRAARLSELAKRIRQRSSRGSLGSEGARATTVVVLDQIRRLRAEEAVAYVLAEGPGAGVVAICLSEDLGGLPAETGASIVFGRSELDDPVVTVAHGTDVSRGVVPEGVALGHAEEVARALAPLFEVGGSASEAGTLPPPPVDHLALLELRQPTADAVLRRWDRARRAEARGPIGVDPTGTLTLDLVRDGPHSLIAGTTGSGKSELLQSLVASLAASVRPDALTFLLVDFKGRSAFKDCESLPHTVGVLSNLDGRLVERALDSIQAELRWRETVFSQAGARDYEEYARLPEASPKVPRLLVVVDELKELADAYGDSIPRLNQTARLGRGLGVHLVLATQKPASVAGLADLRANTDLRICLRVQDEADSRDLVGVPDAAQIPRGAPGRGVVRLSDGRVVPFQAGYLGDPVTADDEQPRIRASVSSFDVLAAGDPPPVRGRSMTVGRAGARQPTKLQVLVRAVGQAAGKIALPSPRRPWLPPLPTVLTIDDLGLDAARGGLAAFPIGLMDLPGSQRQEPLVLDFDQLTHALVVGRTRSGRTTVLRSLAGVVAARSSPADVHLYGLEFRRRSLQELERLPHCGGVTGADDPDRMERLLDFLQAEIDRRGGVMGACGSLQEHRGVASPSEQLPYVLVLCDNYESFYERFSFEDGGRLVERFDWLLREGPARGIHFVVTTDQRAALHRLTSVIDAQLVLRPDEQDANLALGMGGRAPLRDMPPGRGFWTAGPYEVQVALLSRSLSGEGQAAALVELAGKAWAAVQGLPNALLPAKVAALPSSVTIQEAEALRRHPRPSGAAVATFAVGGLDVAPLDVDLRAAGYTFPIAGPRGSGRSTALLSLVTSLLGAPGPDAHGSVCVLAPRRSPLRDLKGVERATILTQAETLASDLAAALALSSGPSVLVVDDAELLLENPVCMQLDQLVRRAPDDERLVVIGGTTVDLLRRFSGWTFEARQSRSGMLLQPSSAAEGEILDLRLPRSTGSQGQLPPGRGVLAVRGRWVAAQVVLPAPPTKTF